VVAWTIFMVSWVGLSLIRTHSSKKLCFKQA
jgi:hypothetical protein